MGQGDSTPELDFNMGIAWGLAFARESKGKGIMRFNAISAPASWRVAENPFKLSHHRFAPKRGWNSANA
jgi:hypothetical protein